MPKPVRRRANIDLFNIFNSLKDVHFVNNALDVHGVNAITGRLFREGRHVARSAERRK